jgi:hypothetical protein
MDAAPREELARFVRDGDPELLQDARRIKGLLQDACPEHRRENALLVAAVEEGVAARIGRLGDSLSIPGELEQLAGDLMRTRAITPEAARWAVGAWAWTLGKGPVPDGEGAEVPIAPPAETPPMAARRPEATPPERRPREPVGSTIAPSRTGDVRQPVGPRPAWGAPPPPRPPRSRSLAVALAVIGAVVGLIIVSGIVAANVGGDSGQSAATLVSPTTLESSTTLVSSTTLASSVLHAIDKTFDTSDSSCRIVEAGALQGGALAAKSCSLTTGSDGRALPSAIDVQYTKWPSLQAMNNYFDEDQQQNAYTEDTWHYDATPSVEEGRYITFKSDDGYNHLDWTFKTKLLSAEAETIGTQKELENWWLNS